MIARLLFLLILLISWQGALAQERFRVLAIRGAVKIGSSTATVGRKVQATETIVVPANGYLSMAHINGRAVEIRKSGTYKVSELDKSASKQGRSASAKFAAYVVRELTDVEEPIAFKDVHRSKMKSTGAVERADNETDATEALDGLVGGLGEARSLADIAAQEMREGSHIVVITPRTCRLRNDSVAFEWHAVPGVVSYTVVITDREQREIYRASSRDTVLVARPPIPEATVCFWKVMADGKSSVQSSEQGLYKLSTAERERIDTMLAEIDEDLAGAGAVRWIVRATACEDEGLHHDAYRSYAAAVREAPNVHSYRRLLAEYLRRNNLHADAWRAYSEGTTP
jgi:hypothetical protein